MEEDTLHKISSALLFKLPSYCFIREGTLEDNTSAFHIRGCSDCHLELAETIACQAALAQRGWNQVSDLPGKLPEGYCLIISSRIFIYLLIL